MLSRLALGTALLMLLAALIVPSAALAQSEYGDNGNGGGGYDSEYDYDSGGGSYQDDQYYDGEYDPYYEDDYEQYDDSYDDPPQPTIPSRKPPRVPVTPVTPTIPPGPPVATVKGKIAVLQSNGKAAIPRGAPKRVRKIIAAGNRLIGKPYKWGGGHAKINDKGYDCSGTVSYALIGGTLLNSPMVSGGLAKWAAAGAGKYVTVYANAGHVYMEVAGLRLDTSPIGDYTAGKGPRWRPAIGKRSGFKVRHPVGL